MAIKVNDESLNDLLPPKMNTQLICAQFFPQNLFGESHLTAKFFPGTARQGRCGALKFFFGDALTWDDVFDGPGLILTEKPLSRLP